ncbi:MAG: DUF3857 domain-containing protein [Candidatus Marinimicrobia bacterium]|nr:DUF3857 domain-containing protein [Candidatus Neomarinimicrobiota bacterium]
MNRRISLCLILFTSLIYTIISCAPASLFSDYWDKIEPPEFERTTSPDEDSPDAVIVFDLERMLVDLHEWDIVRERHVRIQIFTEAGKEWADVRIPFWHDHIVSEIKAQTILPDGRRIKLEQDDIFEEGTEKKLRYKVFALPGVEDQCIIEYQYKYRTTSLGVVQPKYFQDYLRTEYSKFSMTLPQGFEYNATTRNLPRDYSQPEEIEYDSPYAKNLRRFTWEFYDLAPIKDEPYMYNREDHLFSINMQLVRFVNQYNDITFIEEWEDLNKIVLEEYDSYFRNSGPLEKLLTEIKPLDPAQGIQPRDVFLFVRDELTRSSSYSIWPDPMHDVIKHRQGSRVEKNLLLTALLRQAGFQADPVLIARRSYGKLSLSSPNLNNFNHVIVRLTEGEKLSLLDAGFPYSTYTLMPSDNYSGVGLLVAEGDAMFIQFPTATQPSKRDVLTSCKLHDSGSLTGSFQIKSTGFYASRLRAIYAEIEDAEKFAYDELVDHIPGIIVDSVHLELNLEDMQKSVLSTVHFQIPEYFTPGTDMIYLPTTFFQGFQTNELVSEDRTHAIEFNFAMRLQEIVNLELPPGYEVMEAPKPSSISGPGIFFQKQVKSTGKMVQFIWKHQLVEILQPAEKYKQIRHFYTEAVAADQGVLVIKRKDS